MGSIKVFLNPKKILWKQLGDKAEGPVKNYLPITTFTCGGENFLDLDGRSFEHYLSTLRFQKRTLKEDFSKIRGLYKSVFKSKNIFGEATKLLGGGACKILSCPDNCYMSR